MKGKKRILFSSLMFFTVFFIGAVGFKIIGGAQCSFLDSLYMTVITLSTVGYGEVIDFSGNPGARIFTIVFILLSLGTIAFAVTSITSFIVEGELKNLLGRRRMEKEISKLKDHYIVCGSDETAQTVIQELALTKKPFVVVEPLQEKIEKLSSSGDILFVHGDPTEDNILLQAGIEEAKGVILSLPTDEANLFVTITARSLNPGIRIVTKGIDVKSHKKMFKAGSDAVVSPEFIGGMRMVSEMIRPAVVTFLDMMLRDREEVLRFEELHVGKKSALVGKTIGEANIDRETGSLLLSLRRAGSDKYLFNPSKSTEIRADDVLVLIATPDMIQQIEKAAGED
jgi:voltage-gated potassium channel